jgi:hypothetical protein
MSKILFAAVVLSAALTVPHRTAAQRGAAPDQGETVTLTAQVIDVSCKFIQNASGADHKMCAEVCADKGQPLGLLTSDGRFLLPVNAGMGAAGENARLKPFAEQNVRVTGKVQKRAGLEVIVIEKIAKA